MPQFDIHRSSDGALVLDCQSDLFASLNSRLVVPLLPAVDAPYVHRRLHPSFEVDGERYMLMSEFAAAVSVRELSQPIGSLAEHRYEILGAIDLLVTGY